MSEPDDVRIFPAELVEEHAEVSAEFRALLDEFMDENDEALRRLARGPADSSRSDASLSEPPE